MFITILAEIPETRTMNKPLQVLLVEDSECDADLILRQFRRGGYEASFERVDTAAAMTAALERQSWDVIICDYVIPGFGGLEALELFKNRGLDVPFIVVSGHIGEDIAVEAMKAGAHDYIMKDSLARLLPAVERELRDAEMRRARRESEWALQESEERFRELAEKIDVAFFMFDRARSGGASRVLYASRAYEDIWGLPLETLKDGESWVKAVHPDDLDRVIKKLPTLERGEFDHEFRIFTPDRKIRWVHFRTFPVLNERGEVYRVAGLAADITRRKETEEQLIHNANRLQFMVEEMAVVDEDLRSSNAALLETRADLERRVHERTIDLTVANAELQREINERMRLEKELLEIAEKERRRIGFDLHDDLSQKLMGVSFMVKALEQKVANKQLPRLREMRRIKTLIDQALNHTRNLAHEFSSLDVQGCDLAAELEALAGKVRKMFQISCRFTSGGPLPALQQNVTTQLYKIAQEAVSNAIKHGRAGRIVLSLERLAGNLVLAIDNDGVPFPEEKTPGDGIGLRIMSSRASILGASFEICAQGDEGTRVTCLLPLANGHETRARNGIQPISPRIRARQEMTVDVNGH